MKYWYVLAQRHTHLSDSFTMLYNQDEADLEEKKNDRLPMTAKDHHISPSWQKQTHVAPGKV